MKNPCKVANNFRRVSEHGQEDYEFVLLLLTLPYTEKNPDSQRRRSLSTLLPAHESKPLDQVNPYPIYIHLKQCSSKQDIVEQN